jgi:Flp pilus assembly protein TadB
MVCCLRSQPISNPSRGLSVSGSLQLQIKKEQMNNQDPLNPQPTDSDSTIDQDTPQPQQSQSSDGNTNGHSPRGQRAKRSKSKFTLGKIKALLQAKLDGLDNSTLKLILLACGITAAVALAIIAMIKFLPLGVALLSILGLGVVLSMCERLRYIIIWPRL